MKFENLGNMMGPRDRLHFECADCGHKASWSASEAIMRFGASAPPYDVRSRARCGGCGSKRVNVHL